jgi:WD40 repeat protein
VGRYNRRDAGTLTGHNEGISAVAFSSDRQRIVSALYDKTVKVWDVTMCEIQATLIGHSEAVWAIVFSPNRQRIMSASYDKTVKV